MLDTKFEIVNGHQGIQWPWIISRNSQAIKEMWLTSNTPTMLVSGTPVMFIGGKSSNKEAIEVRCKKIVTSVTEQLEKREIKQTIDYINEKKIIYGIKSIAGKITNFRIPSGSSSFETATEPKNLIITFKNGMGISGIVSHWGDKGITLQSPDSYNVMFIYKLDEILMVKVILDEEKEKRFEISRVEEPELVTEPDDDVPKLVQKQKNRINDIRRRVSKLLNNTSTEGLKDYTVGYGNQTSLFTGR